MDEEASAESVSPAGSRWFVKIGKLFVYLSLIIFFAGLLWAVISLSLNVFLSK